MACPARYLALHMPIMRRSVGVCPIRSVICFNFVADTKCVTQIVCMVRTWSIYPHDVVVTIVHQSALRRAARTYAKIMCLWIPGKSLVLSYVQQHYSRPPHYGYWGMPTVDWYCICEAVIFIIRLLTITTRHHRRKIDQSQVLSIDGKTWHVRRDLYHFADIYE
jgi:hypothetical protein